MVRLRAVFWCAVFSAVSLPAPVLGASLCRLGYESVCEPAGDPGFSPHQKEVLIQWAQRYRQATVKGESAVLAFSDLPEALRHGLFLDSGRPLSRDQVKARLKDLDVDADEHPVLRPILEAMPEAFGGEGHYYSGLERAIHRLLAYEPGILSALRRNLNPSPTTAETKTPPAPPKSEEAPRETAQEG